MKSCASSCKNLGPGHLAPQRGSWARRPGLGLAGRRGGETLRAGAALRLLPASCPQVPQAAAGGGGVPVRRGKKGRGEVPGVPRPRVRSGRRGAERDLERRARPPLCEPVRSGGEVGRWAGGRAGMARRDTYTRGGRAGRGRAAGETPPPGTRRGRGARRRRRLARAGPRLRAAAPLGKPPGAQGAGGALPPRAPSRSARPRRRQAAREGPRAGVCNAVRRSAVGGAREGCTRAAAPAVGRSAGVRGVC